MIEVRIHFSFLEFWPGADIGTITGDWRFVFKAEKGVEVKDA